jgi:Flp pilus assembly protein CpaB
MLKTLVIPERARNIAIAVAVAVFAAMLTAFYVSNYKQRVRQEQESVPVLVASGKIEAGTLGNDVVEEKLAVVEEAPRSAAVIGSFAKPEDLRGLVATETIYAGEQVTARRFRPKEERGIRAKLDGNLRAIEVMGTRAQLLAGTLKEGDRTDVVANFELESDGGDTFNFTRTILRDILVVRAPRGADGSNAVSTESDEFTIQLALTDAQAQKLYFATENATRESGLGWWMTIRPVNNSQDSPESIETLWTTLRDGLRISQIRKAFLGSEVAR